MDTEYKTYSLDTLVQMPNIADELEKEHVNSIGAAALAGYQMDVTSRSQWAERNNAGMNLAMQLMKNKVYPWVGASNVKFPLITVAALQYHARAYPALVDGTDVFEARVIGDDPDGKKNELAERISTHMSWSALEQDDGWEEEMDKALLIQCITGSVFKKTVFDPARKLLTSQAVAPGDFVANYYTKNLDTSQRYTHRYFLSENAIRQKQIAGTFSEFKDDENPPKPIILPAQSDHDDSDQRQGMEQPGQDSTTPYWIGEQYCWYDLDGDGFREPYIVSFDIASGRMWRMVARYDMKDVKRRNKDVYDIQPIRVFTKYPFIPSPDGGFYDLGLGALAGPINESVNTILNQLVDAGTMATLGGGFVGRGFKGRGGPFTFKPNEWHPLDGYGDDIRKSVMPLPVREPSATLFQVLGFLVEYGERIVSSTEIQVGSSPGQNQKAETTRILNENGQRIYTGTYKRTWRAMRHEAGVRFDNFRRFLTVDKDYAELTRGAGAMIHADDYATPSIYVRPAADPMVVSAEQRRQNAATVLQNAMQLPGHNKYLAMVNFYKENHIAGYEKWLTKPQTQGPDGKPQPAEDYPPPQDPKMIQAQAALMKAQASAQESQMQVMQTRIMLQTQVEESMARSTELYAKASFEAAQAESEKMEPSIKLLYAQIEAEGKHRDALLKALDMIVKIKGSTDEATPESASAGGNGAGSPSKSNGAGVGAMEAQPADAASSGQPAAVGAGDAGSMGGGSLQ